MQLKHPLNQANVSIHSQILYSHEQAVIMLLKLLSKSNIFKKQFYTNKQKQSTTFCIINVIIQAVSFCLLSLNLTMYMYFCLKVWTISIQYICNIQG